MSHRLWNSEYWDDPDRRRRAGPAGADPDSSAADDEIFEWTGDAGDQSEGALARTTDELLVAQAAVALRLDPLVYGRHLELMVQNRVVILIGELASADARAAAGRRAWTVPGVVDVCNRLEVTGTGAADR